MKQVTIVGAGAVGLALAYELTKRQVAVTVVDLQSCAGTASWAGAGILVPANPSRATHLIDQLAAHSNELHQLWSSELMQLTGIDNQYQKCGGVYVATTPGAAALLQGQAWNWQAEGVDVHQLSQHKLSEIMGANWQPRSHVLSAIHLPDERQIRNPQHLAALREAIVRLGGQLKIAGQTCRLVSQRDRLALELDEGELVAGDDLCIAAGAWSENLLAAVGVSLPVTPVRGQMLLYQLNERLSVPILNEGSRYIVPRRDGWVLVGSTVEEVGFDSQTTAEGISDLQAFAADYFPALSPERCVRQWAGLRPASYDGLPYLGAIPGFRNAWIATGHFRIGLQLSPITAQIMSDLILAGSSRFDLELLNPRRAWAGK